MSEIIIRDITAEDIPAIKKVVREVWAWEELFGSDAVLEACVAIYFAPVLHRATFGRVALLNGEIVGAIFGIADGELPRYKHILEELTPHILLMIQADEQERFSMCEYMTKLNATYEALTDGIEDEYDGTLDFLVLSNAAQGKGIGKQLWLALKEYLESKAVSRVYLYSDNECNFGFYDSQGFARRNKMEVRFVFDGEEEVSEQYLYEYCFDGEKI